MEPELTESKRIMLTKSYLQRRQVLKEGGSCQGRGRILSLQRPCGAQLLAHPVCYLTPGQVSIPAH